MNLKVLFRSQLIGGVTSTSWCVGASSRIARPTSVVSAISQRDASATKYAWALAAAIGSASSSVAAGASAGRAAARARDAPSRCSAKAAPAAGSAATPIR